MKFVLCSDCFANHGLRIEAAKQGVRIPTKCRNCNSTEGMKLDSKRLERLTHRFFVQGTIPHGVGGWTPILMYNKHSEDKVELDEATTHDWLLIKREIGGRLFLNAPNLWQLGITNHYVDPYVIPDETISSIVKQLSIKSIPKGTKVFRIRKNVPENATSNPTQYGLPPGNLSREYGRFDDAASPLLYTSPSVSVCLHECRVAITDDIFVATFEAASELHLADLTANYKEEEPTSPFDALEYFFNGITLTRAEEIYAIARRLASSIKTNLPVDGFIANSFFTNVAQEPISQNICIFPEALERKKVSLHSLNRLHLKTVTYDFVFGPNF
ncbi:RES domain-containing protein [Pseudolabrys taiwanensis]|uniref:RES domain-containing protein n=1 Tax=Pseudolabrys taiwanensis TaxID=331696 RepID=A0A345ZQM4_9HYPH|nr:RES family NAD+ phosphorylase [Pseudolabrys taiwanensis]AXK79221.1 RES domain-containing protein [Pseudolabrys taiwanensis]